MYNLRRIAARLLSAVCGSAFLLASLQAAPPEVIPAQGKPFAATLVAAADDQLEFARDDGNRVSLESSECVRYGNFLEPRVGPLWIFADQSMLVARVSDLEKDNLRGDSKLFGKLSVPVSVLSGVVFRLPADRTQRDLLFGTLSRPRDVDQVVLDNGDKLTGLIEALDAKSLSISTDTGKVELEFGRVAAIAFNSSTMEKSPPLSQGVVLGFFDGSRLAVPSFTVGNEALRFTWFDRPFEAKVSALVALQSISPSTRYLSDLEESSFRHVPYLSLAWPLKKDANVLGQPLRAGDTLYLKGLGMHTASRVTYRVSEGFREFQAELAIDDSAKGKGSAIASVFVDDGSGKWQPRYTSPVVRGSEAPTLVRIDLAGVKAISLLTDFADHGDELDHVDWLSARFVK